MRDPALRSIRCLRSRHITIGDACAERRHVQNMCAIGLQ